MGEPHDDPAEGDDVDERTDEPAQRGPYNLKARRWAIGGTRPARQGTDPVGNSGP